MLNVEEAFVQYDPYLDKETFAQRHAGIMQVDHGERLSLKSIKKIWKTFLEDEADAFFAAHVPLTLDDVLRVGADKLVYILGWTKPKHVSRWVQNKVRVGLCCHCDDQFIALMFQHNHGLCGHCKPLYSMKGMRNFIVHQLDQAERYQHAHRDLLLDFYIMFYKDKKFRKLFLKGTATADELEMMEVEVPTWVQQESGPLPKANPSELGETL